MKMGEKQQALVNQAARTTPSCRHCHDTGILSSYPVREAAVLLALVRACKAKVRQLHHPVLVNQDVGGLEISV